MAILTLTSDNKLKLQCSFLEKELAKKISGAYYNREDQSWLYSFSKDRVESFRKYFEGIEIDDAVIEAEKKETEKESRLLTLKNCEKLEYINDWISLISNKVKLFDHQKVAIQYLLSAESAMLADEMGCLSGKTKIKINRGGNCRTYSLKYAYEGFHNSWRKDIKSRTASVQNGILYLNDILDIIYKGRKKTIKIKSGQYSIEVTPDHEFLTSRGFTEARFLKVGSEILMNGLKYCNICKKHTDHASYYNAKFLGKCKICIYRFFRNNPKRKKLGYTLRSKNNYKLVMEGIRYYKGAARHGYGKVTSVPEHRLVLEAHLNNMSYKKWREIIRNNKFEKHHKFLPKKIIIHHKDENPSNNKLSNLKIVTKTEHKQVHHIVTNFGNYIPKITKITSITKAETQDVYDIKMKAPYHTFVANNFIVHNCGKTLVCLITALAHKKENRIKKAIIVCPATTKYSVWAREIEKFTDEKFIVVDGDKKKRKEQYLDFAKNDAFFLILNYETIPIDFEDIKNAIPFDSICTADESVYIKNNRAKRTKTLKSLKFKYRLACTGYPICNTIVDLHSQFDFIMPNFLGSWWSFCDKYIDLKKIKLGEENSAKRKRKCLICKKWSKESNYPTIHTCKCIEPQFEEQFFKKLTGYKNLDILKKKIEPFYIRRLLKDCISIPDKIYEEREVRLSGNLLKAYNEMRDQMRVTITNMQDEEIEAKANTVLTQMLRLSQLTCGFITDKNLENPEFFKENPKIDSLNDIVDETLCSDRKIVIWTRFRPFTFHLLKHYSEGFKQDGEFRQYKCCHLIGGMSAKEKDDNISKFQNDNEYKIMIGTVQTGGVGVTLHSASVEVFTDISLLSPYTVIQAEQRLWRIGQKNTVVIIKQVAKKTVDERWLKLLDKKQKMSSLLFEDDRVEKLDKETLLELLE